jgi:hypothetical protein
VTNVSITGHSSGTIAFRLRKSPFSKRGLLLTDKMTMAAFWSLTSSMTLLLDYVVRIDKIS